MTQDDDAYEFRWWQKDKPITMRQNEYGEYEMSKIRWPDDPDEQVKIVSQVMIALGFILIVWAVGLNMVVIGGSLLMAGGIHIFLNKMRHKKESEQ